MDSEWTQVILPTLMEIYQVTDLKPGLPEPKQKAQWGPENNIGFFKGIFEYGFTEHKSQVLDLLQSPGFVGQDLQSQKDELQRLLNQLFNSYIFAFHKHQEFANENPPGTPRSVRPTSASNSVTQEILKKELFERDYCCLFCWDKSLPYLQAAHILSRKTIRMSNVNELLQRAGIPNLYDVRNGLLLCMKCHHDFDTLKTFVQVEEDRMLFKAVKTPIDSEWRDTVDVKLQTRNIFKSFIQDDRVPADEDNELRLWFVGQSPTNLPSKEALSWHKAACHIWLLAGGADPEELSDDDEEDFLPPVPAKETMDRVQVWNSAVTMSEEREP